MCWVAMMINDQHAKCSLYMCVSASLYGMLLILIILGIIRGNNPWSDERMSPKTNNVLAHKFHPNALGAAIILNNLTFSMVAP